MELYALGMAALALHRSGDKSTSKDIMASIKDRALHSDELGMYWSTNEWYLWWYESPIETHSLLIEAFHEVTNDRESVEEMKLWLLKQKQTHDWGTTRATVEACNALLNLGTDLLAENQIPAISVGGTILNATNSPEVKVQAGTSCMKKDLSRLGGTSIPRQGAGLQSQCRRRLGRIVLAILRTNGQGHLSQGNVPSKRNCYSPPMARPIRFTTPEAQAAPR
ncbi:MAG: hypothetical protein U0176_23520 [Bacteroidia bacterium]